MYAVGRLSSYISRGVTTVSGPFHPFGGAVDIIVVQQQDGSFKSSPWYVKFGKFQGVLKAKEKVVNISVNGVETDFHMYLDHKGEAYFLKEVDGEEGDSIFSPPSSGDETDEQFCNGRTTRSESCNFDANQQNSDTQNDVNNGKIAARTNSRRSRIFGLVFGRKSMKEDNRQGQEGDAGVERASSLERAEIAADLLEVKWSTNLKTIKPRKDYASRVSAPNMSVEEADKGLLVNDEQSQVSPLVHDSMDNSSDHLVLHEETGPSDGLMGNNSESSSQKAECSAEVTSLKIPCLSTQEQVIMISSSEASDLEDKHGVISGMAKGIGNLCARNGDPDESLKGVISEIVIPDTEHASDERDGLLLRSAVSEVESGMERVQSYSYCEASESSALGMDDSSEQALETLNFSHGECEEVQVRAENLYQTPKLISEVNSQPESGVLAKENLNDSEILEDVDSYKFRNSGTSHESEKTSVNSNAKSIVTESVSLLDICFVTSTEAEILESNDQDAIIKISSETELAEVSENHSQITEKPSIIRNSHARIVSVDQILSSEPQSICTYPSLSNSIHQIQEDENTGEENKFNEISPSLELVSDPQESNVNHDPMKAMSIPPSENLEEDQFIFSDIDDFLPSKVQCKDSISPDYTEKQNHSALTVEGIEDENVSINIYGSSLPSDKLVQEYKPNDFEDLLEEPMVISSPISIRRSRKGAGVEIDQLIESLPNIRSHINSLESFDVLHPLSHSLDLNTQKLNWGLLRKDVSRSLKSDADSELHLVQEQLAIGDTHTFGELEHVSANPVVEISLCKHLLYEGMGADAASQAFDAEKVDSKKFATLGPALVKDDRLVVKLGGRYFPWDKATPIILGMVSYGCEQNFEPEGMIAVERVERTPEGDTSTAIVASSGSWILWPFTFKRSRTLSSVQPVLNVPKSNAENASESTSDMTSDKNVLKVKPIKKKVRMIIPTSEQLASLNLKEGRNTITFKFSTAMLGKQQVDASIYLWKWNTRIVVSDVDGTITKSDVLGQFMPLVGKDWSHTGVAHLFSAIKENGYQLLFLSARAISQAYLTRQFLFNLKQDGKALPDGPVVISPDGVFPSLFREVIRRAPHEFKISCLEDIRALFPPDCNPFYAGFGNRDTDEISYLKVGIPKGKIFIINPKGEVVVNRRVDTKSYTSLHALVNGMFPPMSSAEQVSSATLEDFNSWNYWRMPLPDINI
ncbi:hypothetical protein HHK36_002571 [Tetracentron sinense]|uniref:phosphatidate phosphatase n=1 Tax=Tetracentron sinense TaxID=13715 RepID=A0A834ZMN6_TETSI|nr:hypothetical protein HHK36_002571 [Tetracentron sinense]